MKYLLLFPLTLLYLSTCFSQKNDYVWLMGYGGDAGVPAYGISVLDFNSPEFPSVYSNPEIEMFFTDTNASICDEEGNLLFYFNGIYVEDTSYQMMENGEGLNTYNATGYDLVQGGLALPIPDEADRYMLFHETIGDVGGGTNIHLVATDLYFSIIDMTENGGLGSLVAKKVPLVSDTLDYGKLTATRHANGRDWWVVIRKEESNLFYKILLTPDGIVSVDTQHVGLPIKIGLGQAAFSPDGQHFVQFHTIDFVIGQYVEVYDFDRCTGILSNHRRLKYDVNAFSGGIAISPNSRFIYASMDNQILQFDLWAADIKASEVVVAQYDGFTDPFQTRFHMAQLGPDGKIYLSANNATNYLHVIESPNKKGLACNVVQHGLKLPTRNAFSLPNYPNYRLGPIDGSACDTLGLDNVPVAYFHLKQDTIDYLKVACTDLSYYEPAEWLWDFGDNSTSQDTSPVHIFPTDGSYEVCLTVSNANGTGTYCQTLQIGTVATRNTEVGMDIAVFPNPFEEVLNIDFQDYLPQNATLTLFNALGQPQLEAQLFSGRNTLKIGNISPGVYFYEITEGNKLVCWGKLMKVL